MSPGSSTSEYKVTLIMFAVGALLQAAGAGLAYFAAHAPTPGAALWAGVALATVGTLAQLIKGLRYLDNRTEIKINEAEKQQAEKEPNPPRGAVSLMALFAIVGVFVVGTFAVNGLYSVAIAWAALFALMLLLGRQWKSLVVVILCAGTAGCGFIKTYGGAAVHAISECAAQSAVDVVGPLVRKLGEAAIHGSNVDWSSELERLAGEAKDFKDCMIVAAIHWLEQLPAEPIDGQAPPAIGFKSPLSEFGAGPSRTDNQLLPGHAAAHDRTLLLRGQARLRAALGVPK